MELIPNQPVYLLGNNVCNCSEGYVSPANRSDRVVLLLPNDCTSVAGVQVLENDFTTPDQLALWTQSTDNDLTGIWENGTGLIRTLGDSKILNKPATLSAYRKYTLHVELGMCPNCVFYVVGYTSDGDYDILTSSSTDGVLNLEFSTTKDYVKFGFYIDGVCTGEGDYNELNNLVLSNNLYDCTVRLCLKSDGVEVADLSSYTDQYEGFILLDFYWSDLGIPDGCYQICVCEGLYGVNLFTDGDNGTMEAGITNLSGGSHSSVKSYRGDYSYLIAADDGFPDATLLEGSTLIKLKPNTNYKASAKIYVDQVGDMPVDTSIKLNFDGAISQSSTTVSGSQVQEWVEIILTFSTGDVYSEYTGNLQVLSVGGSTTSNGVAVYIDEILLVEDLPLCSQSFDLADDHDCSLLLSWNNNEEAFNFFPLAYFNLRVKGFLTRPKYPEEITQYEYSDGQRQLQYAESRKVQTLALEKLPEQIHDALRLALLHDHFYVDGKEYVKDRQNEYQPKWTKGTLLAPVEIEIAEKTQLTKNTYCE